MIMVKTGIGQVSITQTETPHIEDFENFDGLEDPVNWVSSDADGVNPTNWDGLNTGSSTTGAKYSYGNEEDADRSFGFLPTSDRAIYADISFINNTGEDIIELEITYDAMHWRNVNGGRTNGWTVSWWLDGVDQGELTDLTHLFEPREDGTGIADPGPWEIVNKSTIISNITIEEGQEFTIRFFGDNGTGSNARQGVGFDNFSLTARGEVCDIPTNLAVDNITAESADITWQAGGDETEWNLIWGESGFNPETEGTLETGITTNTFELTGILDNTEYDVYIQAVCDVDFESEWSPVATFTTLINCDPITTFPFLETFEEDSDSRPCWTQAYIDGEADWTFQTGTGSIYITDAYNGDLNARFVSEDETNSPITKLISPVLDLSGLDNGAELIFYLGQPVFSADQNESKVYYRESETDAWVEIAHFTENIDEWTEVNMVLPNPSATYQIAFEGINNYGHPNVIDDVSIREIPTCPVPTNVEATALSSEEIELSWEVGSTETEWNILWGESGFDPNTQGTAENGVLATNFTFSNLNPETDYDFYVMAVCDIDDESEWTPVATTTTFVSCPAPGSPVVTITSVDEIQIGWPVGGDETEWNVLWGETGFDPETEGTLEEGLISTTFTATGLEGSTMYDFYVQAVCDIDDESEWVMVTGETDCAPPVITEFPFTENFDDITTPELPCGWVVTDNNEDQITWETSAFFPNSSPSSMKIGYNSTLDMDDWFYTPELVFESGVTYELEFYYRARSATYPESMTVWLGTGQDVSNMDEILIDLQNFTNDEYVVATVNFSPENDGSYHIGFHGNSEAYQYEIYVDDITVSIVSENCENPTNLTTDNITETSADLIFESSNDGADYAVTWGILGFDPLSEGDSETGTSVEGMNVVSITGLEEGIEYEFYVSESCNGDETDLIGPEQFFTLVSCEDPTDFQVGFISNTTADVSWTSSNTDANYQLIYGEFGFDPLNQGLIETGVSMLGSNSHILPSLTPNTAYDVYLVEECADNINTSTLGPITFTTTNTSIALFDNVSITVYPNPTQENVFIRFDGTLGEDVRLSIYSIDGRLIQTNMVGWNNSNSLHEIDLSNEKRGVYFLRMQTEKAEQTVKIIKQ